MNLELQNKVIIVTGGAKGIGEGIVRVLAEEGALPVIIGRNEADNLKLVEALKAKGQKSLQVKAELSKPEECENAIKQIIKLAGRIDGLVNNAGVNDGVGLEKGNYEAFMKSVHSNL